jgi:nucleotide-binding universal stress UspA family protein
MPAGSEDAMYKQIVVGTDGSTGANMAVDAAMELARLSGATLHVVNAHKLMTAYQLATAADVGIAPVDVGATNDAIVADGKNLCEQVVERAKKAGVQAESHVVGADPADALMRVVEETGADLLVVGNRGMTGARRFVLGSVPNKVSHHCHSSLLIVDTSETRA